VVVVVDVVVEVVVVVARAAAADKTALATNAAVMVLGARIDPLLLG
jgi:hypothetical protein